MCLCDDGSATYVDCTTILTTLPDSHGTQYYATCYPGPCPTPTTCELTGSYIVFDENPHPEFGVMLDIGWCTCECQ